MVVVNVEGVCTSHWQTSADEEQEDWNIFDSVYVAAGGVDTVLVKATLLLFVSDCISILCVCRTCVCLMLAKRTALAALWSYQWEHQPLHL